MAHLKRFAAPRSWPIERKTKHWVARPKPGAHKLDYSLPLGVALRDLLNYTRNLRESKKILSQGKAFVNGKARKAHSFGVGLFDVVSLPDAGEHYLMLLDRKGKLFLERISEKEAETKISKIVNKTTLKGNMVQLNLHDGRSMLVKGKGDYKTKDSVIVDLGKNEIASHLPYEAGSTAFVLRGSHVGEVARIKQIIQIKSSLPNLVELESGGVAFRTSEDSIIIIGKEKPVLSVLEKEVAKA